MTMAGGPGQIPGQVAGANGMPATPPSKLPTQGGGGDAVAGATGVAGSGGNDLITALNALNVAVKALADVVAKMAAGGSVAGVQGSAASANQFVAAPTVVSTASNEDDGFEGRVLDLINIERAKGGLAAVGYNGTLDNAAEKHASHMSVAGAMAHEGIGDGTPGERIRAEGYRNAWGENVATGQTSPEQVVREWMNSPDHRRNIMDPNFTQMGVSYVTASNGRSYWAQEFGA